MKQTESIQQTLTAEKQHFFLQEKKYFIQEYISTKIVQNIQKNI